MKHLILILSVMLASVVSNAQADSKPAIPLFIKAKCDGKLSSLLVASFNDAMNASKAYRLVATIDDEGRNDKVLYVQMACTERNSAVALATAYGIARCVTAKECHMALDGSSMGVTLCDPNGEAQCGAELFKAMVLYANTAKPILKVD